MTAPQAMQSAASQFIVVCKCVKKMLFSAAVLPIPPRYRHRAISANAATALLQPPCCRCPPPPAAAALLPRCHASIPTAVAVLPMPPPTPSTSPPPVYQSTPLPSPSPSPPPPPAATTTANATPIALATATAKTTLSPALVNVTGPRPEARRAGTAPSAPPRPPLACRRLPSHVAVRGTAPVAAAGGHPGPKEEASRTMTVAIAASPYHLSPLSLLPPLPPPPMPPPPHPHPCLRSHYRCSLFQPNAPVDGWFWFRLSPLAYCVVRRPNLSAPAIVRSSTLSPLGRRPLLLTIASHCPVTLLPRIDHFHRSR
jgi:hypothetical protein